MMLMFTDSLRQEFVWPSQNLQNNEKENEIQATPAKKIDLKNLSLRNHQCHNVVCIARVFVFLFCFLSTQVYIHG